VAHSSTATASPPRHTKPASHSRVGVDVPVSGQVKPGVQATQAASDALPDALTKVPAGQEAGAAAPASA